MRKYFFIVVLNFFILTACSSKHYQVEVDLTPEQKQELESQINDYQKELEKLKAEDNNIIYQKFVEMALVYQELGQLDQAIEVYKNALNEGYKSSVLLHNLGRLYEEVEDYKNAVKTYQKIITDYQNKDYLLDIALIYMKEDDLQNTEEYYTAWKAHSKQTDPFIESYLNEQETK